MQIVIFFLFNFAFVHCALQLLDSSLFLRIPDNVLDTIFSSTDGERIGELQLTSSTINDAVKRLDYGPFSNINISSEIRNSKTFYLKGNIGNPQRDLREHDAARLSRLFTEKSIDLELFLKDKNRLKQFRTAVLSVDVYRKLQVSGSTSPFLKSIQIEINSYYDNTTLEGAVQLWDDLMSSFKTLDLIAIEYDGAPLMLSVARSGDVALVEKLLKNGADINIKDYLGTTALMTASSALSGDMITFLVKNGADINATNIFLENALNIMAVQFLDEEVVLPIINQLIDLGIDFDAANNLGETPLFSAAQHGHIQTFMLLKEKGANIYHKTTQNRNLLMYACADGDVDIINSIIDKFDVNARDSRGLTALHEVSTFGNAAIAHFLIQLGAVVDSLDNEHKTPLMYAAVYGANNVMNELLSSGANVNAADLKGNTALLYASAFGITDTVVQLLANDAIVDSINEDGNFSWLQQALDGNIDEFIWDSQFSFSVPTPNVGTPLMYAVVNDNLFVVQHLINAGAQVDLRIGDGVSALLQASKRGYNEVAKHLIQAGANVNQTDSMGNTPLIYAVKAGASELVIFLLEKGVDLRAENSQSLNAIQTAVLREHIEILDDLIQYEDSVFGRFESGGQGLLTASVLGFDDALITILKYGFDPDITDQSGFTALMFASMYGHLSSLEVLLHYNASVNKQTFMGMTALMYAASNGHRKVVARLLSHPEIDVNITTKNGVSAMYFATHNDHHSVIDLLVEHNADQQVFMRKTGKKREFKFVSS